MSMLEAECTRCEEIFVPHGTDPEDLIHGETYAGEACGGIGVIQGEWYTDRPRYYFPEGILTPQEKHGLDAPDCRDSDCEFHHPEVVEHDLEYHSDSCLD